MEEQARSASWCVLPMISSTCHTFPPFNTTFITVVPTSRVAQLKAPQLSLNGHVTCCPPSFSKFPPSQFETLYVYLSLFYVMVIATALGCFNGWALHHQQLPWRQLRAHVEDLAALDGEAIWLVGGQTTTQQSYINCCWIYIYIFPISKYQPQCQSHLTLHIKTI